MSVVAGFADPWAHLVRGFVEAGLPDATRGGERCPLDGQLNVENLLHLRSATQGLVVEFPGPMGVPAPEVFYSVRLVAAGPAFPIGVAVEVRCPESLMHHLWSVEDPATLGARIVAHLRTHHAAFLDWRRKGGEVSYAERLGIPALPVDPPDPAFVRFLGGLYGEGLSVADGPAKDWWSTRPGGAWAGRITAGQGQEPSYRLGRGQGLDPEDVAHAARLRRLGWWMGALGVTEAIVAVGSLGFFAWALFAWASPPWTWLLGGLLASTAAGLSLAAAQALVRQHDRWLFRDPGTTRAMVLAGAATAMLPCAGPCCLGGLPLGALVCWRVLDERTARVWAAVDAPPPRR
jgi:hypothetical protein